MTRAAIARALEPQLREPERQSRGSGASWRRPEAPSRAIEAHSAARVGWRRAPARRSRALAVAAALLALATARVAVAADEASAVRAELQREVTAWNAGDIDGYLAGYERSPTTTMIGRLQLYRGWDAIAAMYHARFANRRRMGTLAFSDLEIRVVAPDYAVVIGRWGLLRAAEDGGPVGGFFTLTLHKGATGWRIILDHTS
jgi:uncharacterized protein (TIGR02246 family)